MTAENNPNVLSALAWLLEAGADEAVGESPVNRFQTKTAALTSDPPLEGGSKNQSASARGFFGEGSGPQSDNSYPSPKTPSALSTLPQGEGGKSKRSSGGVTARRSAVTPTAVLNPHAHDNDHIGRALEIANACNSLPELKAALEAFE